MTLEEYIRKEYAEGKIDFTFRAEVFAGVRIYIHPSGRDGATTPLLLVEGNKVSLAPGSYSPDWKDE